MPRKAEQGIKSQASIVHITFVYVASVQAGGACQVHMLHVGACRWWPIWFGAHIQPTSMFPVVHCKLLTNILAAAAVGAWQNAYPWATPVLQLETVATENVKAVFAKNVSCLIRN
jgi:hypothetical protein